MSLTRIQPVTVWILALVRLTYINDAHLLYLVPRTAVMIVLSRIMAPPYSYPRWLIYKCPHCGTTWNLEIASRVRPQDIPPSQLHAMELNDTTLAWHYAFDIPTLRRSGAQIQYPTDYHIAGEAIDMTKGGLLTVELEFPFPFDLRLGRLLQQQLCLSRTQVHRLAISGALSTKPFVDITRHKVREPRLQIIIDRHALRAMIKG